MGVEGMQLVIGPDDQQSSRIEQDNQAAQPGQDYRSYYGAGKPLFIRLTASN